MDSIHKLIDYVAKVSKVPITVDGKVVLEKPVSRVTLSQNFFLKDDCYMCGRCCPNENTAYTETCFEIIQAVDETEFSKWGLDFSYKEKLLAGSEEKILNVNGKEIKFYSHPSDKPAVANKVTYEDRGTIQRCHWLFQDDAGLYKCRIHPMRSITCGMPHLRFFYNSKNSHTSLGVSQFGRNWALGCPVEFGTYDEESVQGRIHWLRLLEVAADDLGIETYLPEILDYLDSGKREPRRFSIQTKGGLF